MPLSLRQPSMNIFLFLFLVSYTNVRLDCERNLHVVDRSYLLILTCSHLTHIIMLQLPPPPYSSNMIQQHYLITQYIARSAIASQHVPSPIMIIQHIPRLPIAIQHAPPWLHNTPRQHFIQTHSFPKNLAVSQPCRYSCFKYEQPVGKGKQFSADSGRISAPELHNNYINCY